ncbi:RcnB family protein [Sphingomonas sp. MMS24-J13]|uniref:RcnB family protein n=1 Tax=Sphingomonas sp. MMS24-J13 TaxID=3238686 RepID=UPI00384EA9C0
MKKFILAALAATIVTTPVLAAPNWNNDDRGHNAQRYDRHDRDGRPDRAGNRFDRGDRFDRHDRHDRVEYRNWNRGQRFDSRYAYNYRVIQSPRVYRLHDAPRGYRWVQSGNDAVLVGITSGIVASVLANAIR